MNIQFPANKSYSQLYKEAFLDEIAKDTAAIEALTLEAIQGALTALPEIGPELVDYAGGGEGTQVSLDGLVRNYAAVARGLAVRIAVQGPLARYFEGVQYDPASDSFQATSGRELIPLFTKVLEDAPVGAASNDNDANDEAIDLICFSFEKKLGAGGGCWLRGIAA